ncbi:uncharacterized protein LOC135144431 isoform X2 [Zophobas morio]|uniref:uncharacterized protein LOC135144431 isoform X2 n=1 Tax=Zophobas morio TaxID=2755281 RepID=UPI0030830BAA
MSLSVILEVAEQVVGLPEQFISPDIKSLEVLWPKYELAKRVTELYEELYKIQERIQQQKLSLRSSPIHIHSTSDLHQKIVDFSGLLNFVIKHLQSFQLQLQNPYRGPGIDVHPDYHKDVLSLFENLQLISDYLNKENLAINYLRQPGLIKQTLEQLLYKVTSLLAILRRNYESICNYYTFLGDSAIN